MPPWPASQEMHRAQLAAEQYLLQGKAYLECGLMNRRQYSQLLSQLEIFFRAITTT